MNPLDANNDYLYSINSQKFTFKGVNKIIADYFQDHEKEIINYSITQIAHVIGVTPSSITKFCQKLHYKGWSDFRYSLKNSSADFGSSFPVLQKDDSILVAKDKFLNACQLTLNATFTQINCDAVQRAASFIMKSRNMIILGDGSTIATAMNLHTTLLQLGILNSFFDSRQMGLAATAQLGKDDVLMYVCRTGASRMIRDCVQNARKTDCTTIGILAQEESPLAEQTDIILSYSAQIPDDLRYLQFARICELAVIGLLQITIINALTPEKLLKMVVSKESITNSILLH